MQRTQTHTLDAGAGSIPHAFRYYVRLARIRAWLERNYAGEVSLRVAAGVAGLNAKYFSKFFHDKTGVRFSEWVQSVRIEKATEMMRQSNHSITSVAFEVGFRDLRTFERVFKKRMGMTPREYRESVRPHAGLRSCHA